MHDHPFLFERCEFAFFFYSNPIPTEVEVLELCEVVQPLNLPNLITVRILIVTMSLTSPLEVVQLGAFT